MKITKYAQFTFLIESIGGSRILIDPGKYNYSDNFTPADFGKIDFLIITHDHADHHDPDAEKSIIDLYNPVVYTNSEIAEFDSVKGRGYIACKVGDILKLNDVKVTLTTTDHFAKGEDIVNFGMYFEENDKSFYHTSDTRFMEKDFFEIDLVSNCDVLTVPISNRGLVMGVDDAAFFTSMIKPSFVIPAHYDSPKDKERVSPHDFAQRIKDYIDNGLPLNETSVSILSFGETIEI